MTTARKIEFETVSLLLLAVVVGIVFAYYFNRVPKIRTTLNLPVMTYTQPTPTPTPIPKTLIVTELSPNGGKKVTMAVTTNKGNTKTYAFSVSNGDGSGQQALYTITLPPSESMSIPYNSFSPDNKYLFLTHTIPTGTEGFVFRVSGDPMTGTDQYFNTATIFAAKQTGNTYQETTGWASETLLIINTTAADGTKSTSYWLEVPSKAIIPLATQF